jgi:PE family protein
MSFVFAAPQELAAAASGLAGIGSTVGAANAAAAAPTTGVLASAADQVSAQVAALLSEHGLGYQQVSAQMAAFHERFVQTLSAGASTYAAAEANAAQTLTHPVNAPAAAAPGQPSPVSGIGSGAAAGGTAAGGIISNALGRIEGAVLGANFSGAASQAGALLLRPTGGISALTAARRLLAPAAMTNAAAVAPAAVAAASLGDTIKAGYLAIEPWVQYGFNLAAYAVGFVPYVGFLAPQINIFFYLFEPIVQSGLFNTIDLLQGTITFSQGLSNFFGATTASINQFIQNEINWAFGYILPPLPPIPPF